MKKDLLKGMALIRSVGIIQTTGEAGSPDRGTHKKIFVKITQYLKDPIVKQSSCWAPAFLILIQCLHYCV